MLDAHPAPDALARPPLPATAIDPPASPARPVAGDALYAAALTLLPVLEAGSPLDAAILRDAMTRAFGGSDASGAWVWKDAYEAAEAAAVKFLQRYGKGMRANAGGGPDGPRRMLAMLHALAALEPSHTKRSEEQIRLQQFSTPLPLAYAALQAAAIRPGDTVLEPSAGTGMLAVMAECALGKDAVGHLHLNEYARTRARLLDGLFPQAVVTAFNAEAIADRLHDVRPTVVLMNPPFSVSPERQRHGLRALVDLIGENLHLDRLRRLVGGDGRHPPARLRPAVEVVAPVAHPAAEAVEHRPVARDPVAVERAHRQAQVVGRLAPAEAQQPMNAGVQSVVESIDAPAVADRRAAALASAVNADATPPVAASAPEAAGAGDLDAMRITIAGDGSNVPVEPEQVMAPPRGNGQDNKAELLEIPAFLRRG